MKLMIAGATTTVEDLLPDPDVAPYLGAMVTPNTSNGIGRICGWDIPWCIDNACFDETKFNPAQFVALMYKAGEAPTLPVFACVPDVVGDHQKTLARFDLWFPKLEPMGVPLAFVAQDGMGLDELEDDVPWDDISTVFIGGTDQFKDDMTGTIAEACKARGKWCHLGRVNGRKRLKLALLADVDSVDGSSLSRFGRTWIPKFAKDIKDLEQEVCHLDRLGEQLAWEVRALGGIPA